MFRQLQGNFYPAESLIGLGFFFYYNKIALRFNKFCF